MPHCGTSGKAIFFLYYKNRVFAVRKEAPCIPLDVRERVQGNHIYPITVMAVNWGSWRGRAIKKALVGNNFRSGPSIIFKTKAF